MRAPLGVSSTVASTGPSSFRRASRRVERIEPAQPLSLQMSDGRTLLCRVAVDATNSSITSPRSLPLRQAAYRSYCLAIAVAPGTIPHGLYWDTADPYHYVRVAPGDAPERELVIVGGEDHRTGQGEPMQAWIALAKWARRWLKLDGPVVARWSGQIIEPVDGPAHIGRSPGLEHVYVITGDSGNGLTHGTIGGLLIPELMRGHNRVGRRLRARPQPPPLARRAR
jgi:glycine/D-amino acid oxidase-like deaminating enzyme